MPEIRDRIHDLLKKTGLPLPASQILQEALNICSPNNLAAQKVLLGILGDDPQFGHREGQWFLRSAPSPSPLHLRQKTVFLVVQRAHQSTDPIHMRGALYWTGRDRVLAFDSSMRIAFQDLDEMAATTDALIFWQRREFQIWNRYLARLGWDGWHGATFCLESLATQVLQRPSSQLPPEDLASLLDIRAPCAEESESIARFYCHVFERLLAQVPQDARSSVERLQSWLDAATPRIDYSRFSFDRHFLDQLPRSPGTYIMKDRHGHIVYVGKSRDLRRRVRSYFTSKALSDPKTARIHKHLFSIEVCETPNEVEALLLEMNLIRDFRPGINLQQEVHEQRTAYAKERNLILLSPRPGGSKADVYYLVRGLFAGQAPAELGVAAPKKIQTKIRSLYFSKRRQRTRHRELWETELISRWFCTNQKRLNWVDVDEAGNFETTLRRLDSYLMDPERLSEKVFYR
jgi:hypothetical protein